MTYDLAALLPLAIRAAESARDLIASKRGTAFDVERKDGVDSLAAQVVTEVDRAAEAIIREHLMQTVGAGELGYLGEESQADDSRFSCEAFWCVDPLDGTLPFIEGSAGFATSIALVARDGTPLVGVVADPVTGNLWAAAKGMGVTKNGIPFTLSTAGEVFRVYADRSFEHHPRFEESMATLSEISATLDLGPIVIDMEAGAVLNAMKILESGPGCYFKFGKPRGGGSLWDYAATACCFAELGLPVSDLDGHPLDLNRSDSTLMNHRGVVYASDARIAAAVRRAFG